MNLGAGRVNNPVGAFAGVRRGTAQEVMRMSCKKHMWLPLMALGLALLVPAARMAAAEEGGAAAASHATAHGESHAGHAEIDERLVPIPPSHDTIVTSVWV